MPIIRTLKETGISYEAAKQRLLEATAHLDDDDDDDFQVAGPRQKAHTGPKRRRIISDSSSSSSSSSSNGNDDDDDGDGDDDDDDNDEEDEEEKKRERVAIHKRREKKLLKHLEKEMKRKRNVVSISRPSSYKRTEMHSFTPAKPKTKKPKSAMAMISALNESSEEPDSDEESEVELTREAQEEEAFSLYKKALEFQHTGELLKAQQQYTELIQTRFLSKVKATDVDRRGGVTNTAISLKYSTYKNLGKLAAERDDLHTAMENYLEAVALDSTDVTLWYKIGTSAVKLHELALARVAFEQGLRCSKHHWPCLDFLCTVLYAINDYVTCLYYVAQALEKDKRYVKGFALRDQIFAEQPSLQRECLDLFKHCDDDVLYYEAPKDKKKKVIDHALSLRLERQKLAKAPPIPKIKFLRPLTEFRWKLLGERLIALYDHMTSRNPPMSFITILDLEDYKTRQPKVKTPDDPIPMGIAGSPIPKPDMTQTTEGSRQDGSHNPTDNPPRTPEHTGMQKGEQPAPEGGELQQGSALRREGAASESEEGQGESALGDGEQEGVAPTQGIGASARSLKQLAEEFLKRHSEAGKTEEPDASIPMSTCEQTEKQAEHLLPPDSTTLSLDSIPAPADIQMSDTLLDSTAGSSQDSVKQLEAESNMDSSQLSFDKDAEDTKDDGKSKQNETDDHQSDKSRRGQKRRRMLRDDPVPGKRRSARVRNTTVKKKEEEELVNYTEVLRQFLPSTLLVTSDDEEDIRLYRSGEQSKKKAETKRTEATSVSKDAFVAMESDDVFGFLGECQANNGLLDVMSRYLERLVDKQELRWPDGLAAVFLDVYKRLRNHTSLPELLCCDEEESVVRVMSMMVLMAAEFNLDQCLAAKTNGGTPAASPAMLGGNTVACTHNWGKHNEDDLMYLQELTLMQYMLPDLWPSIPARVYWLRARYFLQVGKTAEGEDAYERCKDVLKQQEDARQVEKQARTETEGQRSKEEGERSNVEDQRSQEQTEEKMELDAAEGDGAQRIVEVVVPNIRHGGLISRVTIESDVESLQRCQTLEQLQRLHAVGNHAKVVELLRPTLRLIPRGVGVENTTERCNQLMLLVQSQAELKNAKESVVCCILGLGEAWQGVRTGDHQQWLATLNRLLSHLQKAFESCEIGALGGNGSVFLRKAVSILVKIIEWSMDQPEVNELTNEASIMPWVVLYHVIKYEEDHLSAKSLPVSEGETDRSRSPSPVPMLPSSLMLLENAHDYLGRRSWCCNSEGALLKLYARVLSEELARHSSEGGEGGERQHPFAADLRHTLEQCFFCLYGHPARKAKTRHLQDHGVVEVPLDWPNCSYIFDYFKPKVLPEFDSYKTSSMSAELEGLLLKISKVIPMDARPANALEMVQAYVDGTIESAPSLPEGFDVASTVIQELYYLLADFYFKNKDFGKAIKFYLHDLCVSPDRLDSWAGMAFARVGRLDLKLNNSSDSKSDGPIFKHGMAALRCFKRALEIDSTNYSLWIEYGSYAYILHSNASRQIKQRDQLKIGEEEISLLKEKQRDMLDMAENCFVQASSCEGGGDEEWLVHYMLGKIAEKRTLMEKCLQHYLQASSHLHENEARYPKKIPYHNPPDLSLEALEMYFRIHSAVLKLVQCSLPGVKLKLDTYGTLEGLVQAAAQLPFVRAEEKKRDPSSEHSTDTETESRTRPFKPDTPPSLAPPTRGSPIYVATPQDHDYLHDKHRRARSRVSSQEETATDTTSESDMFSGDESIPSFPPISRTIALRPVPARRAQTAAESLGNQAADSKVKGQGPPEGQLDSDTGVPFLRDSKMEGRIPDIVISKASPEIGGDDEADDGDIMTSHVKGQSDDPMASQIKGHGDEMTSGDRDQREGDLSVLGQQVEKSDGDDAVAMEIDGALAMDKKDRGGLEETSSNACEEKGGADKNLEKDAGITSEEKDRDILEKDEEREGGVTSMDEGIAEADRKIGDGGAADLVGIVEKMEEEKKWDTHQGEDEEKEKTGKAQFEEKGAEDKQGKEEMMEVDDGKADSTMVEDIGKETTETVPEDDGRTDGELKEEGLKGDGREVAKETEDAKKDEDGLTANAEKEVSTSVTDMEQEEQTQRDGGKDRQAQREEAASVSTVSSHGIHERTGLDQTTDGSGDHGKEEKKLISEKEAKGDTENGINKLDGAQSSTPDVSKVAGNEKEQEEGQTGLIESVVEVEEAGGEVKEGRVDDVEMETLSGQLHDDPRKDGDKTRGDNGDGMKDGIQKEGQSTDGRVLEGGIGSSERQEGEVRHGEDGKSTDKMEIISGQEVERRKEKSKEESEQKEEISKDKKEETKEGKTDEEAGGDNAVVEKETEAKSLEEAKHETPRIEEEGERKREETLQKEGEIEGENVQTEGKKDEMRGKIGGTGGKKVETEKERTGEQTKTEKDGKKADGQGATGAADAKERATEGKKEEAVEVDEKTKERHLKLVDACLGAMRLCLLRFPQHYKAAYRMAYLYAYAPTHKNLSWGRDILLGGGSGYPLADHVVAPGLFSEIHKSKNLFQGIWRNPIQDIDRSGSFPWHMYRSVALLVHILRELNDHVLLLQVAIKLDRTPEAGKKYLRDSDRVYLARRAFECCIASVTDQSSCRTATHSTRLQMALFAYRCLQVTQLKMTPYTPLASDLLVKIYTTFRGGKVESEIPVLEQALRFCTQYSAYHKLPTTPTFSEGVPSKYFTKEGPISSSSRPGQPSESRRPLVQSHGAVGTDVAGSAPREMKERVEGARRDGGSEGVVGRGMEELRSVAKGVAYPSRDYSSAVKDIGRSQMTQPDSQSSGSVTHRVRKEEVSQKPGLQKVRPDTSQMVRQAGMEVAGVQRGEETGVSSVGGVKRKILDVGSSSGGNAAGMVREAARQYETSTPFQSQGGRETIGEVQQKKRFAGEPSSSLAHPGEKPRVYIGALGSVVTAKGMTQQRHVPPSAPSGPETSSSTNIPKAQFMARKQAALQGRPLGANPQAPKATATTKAKGTPSSAQANPSWSSFSSVYQQFLSSTYKGSGGSNVKAYHLPPSSSVPKAQSVAQVKPGSLLGNVSPRPIGGRPPQKSGSVNISPPQIKILTSMQGGSPHTQTPMTSTAIGRLSSDGSQRVGHTGQRLSQAGQRSSNVGQKSSTSCQRSGIAGQRSDIVQQPSSIVGPSSAALGQRSNIAGQKLSLSLDRQSTGHQTVLQPRLGVSQVAKVTSSTSAGPQSMHQRSEVRVQYKSGVKGQGSVTGARGNLSSSAPSQAAAQIMGTSREQPGSSAPRGRGPDVDEGRVVTQGAARGDIRGPTPSTGSREGGERGQGGERKEGSGDDLLAIIDSTK